jgi:hypothetical protein
MSKQLDKKPMEEARQIVQSEVSRLMALFDGVTNPDELVTVSLQFREFAEGLKSILESTAALDIRAQQVFLFLASMAIEPKAKVL